MKTAFNIGVILFFGWMVADSLWLFLYGHPIGGIYYPSGGIPRTSGSLAPDWTNLKNSASLFMLILMSLWWFAPIIFVGRAWINIAAFTTAFWYVALMAVVPLVTADIYNHEINLMWSLSMIYCFIIFTVNYGVFQFKENVSDEDVFLQFQLYDYEEDELFIGEDTCSINREDRNA